MAELKKYTNRNIFDTDEGIIYKNPDGSYRISGVTTKPNGSNSDFLSIGKFSTIKDKFGDESNVWVHYDYPSKFEFEGFAVKCDYSTDFRERHRASTQISWSFIIPPDFIEQGFGIAKVGSGAGGRGCRKTDIEVFFDRDRIERGTDVIFS